MRKEDCRLEEHMQLQFLLVFECALQEVPLVHVVNWVLGVTEGSVMWLVILIQMKSVSLVHPYVLMMWCFLHL